MSGHDGVLAALLNCLKTQLLILCGAIQTIRPRVFTRLKIPTDISIHLDDDYSTLEDVLYTEIIHLNQHLTSLLR